MSQLMINDNSIMRGDAIFKIRSSQIAEARKDARSDGLRNIFFTIGSDNWVISGKNLTINGVSAGDRASFNGNTGIVTDVDPEKLPTMGQNIKNNIKWGSSNGITATAVGSVIAAGTLMIYKAITSQAGTTKAMALEIAGKLPKIGIAAAGIGLIVGGASAVLKNRIIQFAKGPDYNSVAVSDIDKLRKYEDTNKLSEFLEK